ncbi:MAG: mechanosensitive ion channel domain-containing protein [Cyanobacteria bacterium P01_D01_bin.128]
MKRYPNRREPPIIRDRHRLFQRWNRRISSGLTTLILSALVAIALSLSPLSPGLAQSDQTIPDSAPVVIDGNTLFQVASTQSDDGQSDDGQSGDGQSSDDNNQENPDSEAAGFSARERADEIGGKLALEIEAETAPRFGLTYDNRTPVITLNGTQLISVTVQDLEVANALTPNNPRTLNGLAEVWLENIEEAMERARRERQPRFLKRATITAVVVALSAIALHFLLGRLWRRYFPKLLNKITLAGSTDEDVRQPAAEINLLLNGTLLLVRLLLWGGATFYITNLFPLTRQWAYTVSNALINTFVSRSFSLGDRFFSVLDLLVLVVLIVGLVLAASALTNLLRSRFLRIAGLNRGAREAVAILIRYSLISIGTVVILQVWGLDLSSLALLASALSVGIGLGLQNIARDFGSGLVLVFERPIQVGEFVEFGDFRGTVERIGARSTEIKTLDQVSIIVPNSRFLDQELINWSHRNPVSRIRLPVGVAYSSDPQQVKQVLLDAGTKHRDVIKMPPPLVLFDGFGDSALDFQLLVWIAEPSKQLIIRSDLYFAIEAGLKQHGIEIPFPQRDLHVRSGTLPVELPPELRSLLTQWANGAENGRPTN